MQTYHAKVERGNVSTGYYVKQDRVVINDSDIPPIIKISGSYIAADILVTRYLDGMGEFIKVSELGSIELLRMVYVC